MTRACIVPPKSTNSSVLSAPNAAKSAMVPLPMTTSLSAKHAGMTIAARAARRSAARPGSRARSRSMRAAGVSRDRPARPLMARPYRPPARPVRGAQCAPAASSVRTISA